jgi:hexosaminidase
MLDLMAFYKLNKFHFHITDDEGWRLEMAALPELTEVGSRRGHTLDESDHLYPSFGSGPDPNPAVSHGSGYYTRADFIEILRYAGARHIEVIPEIDMPGHARAAIKAMDARYARLTAAGQTTDAESLLLSESAFLLSEAGDMSEYLSVQMWRDNVVNVCQASTYRFLETVVDEIQSMYDEAGVPLTTIHTGGDEVPHGAWEQSPTCTRLIQEQEDLHSVHDLTRYFLRNFSRILNDRGLITGGWEEIALMPVEQNGQTVHVPNPEFLESRFRMNVWNNVWGWGSEANAYKLANAGYEVVLSNATNLYFDLAYNKDPEEPGYYWANFVNTRTAFEFIPFNFYQNATVDRMGHAIDPATYAGHERLTDAGRQNILGIQGQLWGENAKGPERLEYMAFPRILALSERAWTAQPAWAVSEDDIERNQELTESWSRFAHTTGRRELPRLDYLDGGVEYRIPLPGAIIEHGMLNANIAFPGLVVRYTTDGTEPTTSSTLYTEPVAVQGTVKLKAFDTRGRSSRTSVIE